MIHRFLLGTFPCREPGRRSARLNVAMALVALMSPLGGCSVGGSATGEGTVDVSSAKGAGSSNPEFAKAAAVRGKGGMADAQKTRRK